MADKEFNQGDVVRLKSGGPSMTVAKLDNYGFGRGAACMWFPDPKSLEEKVFPLHTLEHVSTDAKGEGSSAFVVPRRDRVGL
jgi:uncharacterized protein YodC (DUF2158 family)